MLTPPSLDAAGRLAGGGAGAPTTPGEPTLDELREAVATNPMKRVSVICLQCGLSVARLIHAETAQTEIDPVTYQRKCKIAPNAADFYCPELERAVERSRRWDQIFRSGMYRLSAFILTPVHSRTRLGLTRNEISPLSRRTS
jgi:hypothetical protein